MAVVKEYKVTHTINDIGLYFLPKTLISIETYNTLGIFQDRVQIIEREVPDELLAKEIQDIPNLEVVDKVVPEKEINSDEYENVITKKSKKN
jgi:methyl coenzyme M reductase subunit C-like uncharacterized protein (methanogenesis marker protein 7)